MDRVMIIFDLDTAKLQDSYRNSSFNNAYADIRQVLEGHGFANIQGSVYLGNEHVRQAHGTIAIQQLTAKHDWFSKCVRDVRFLEISDDFDARFIIDGVERQRQAFNQTLSNLRATLLAANIPLQTVEDLLSKQVFTAGTQTPQIE